MIVHLKSSVYVSCHVLLISLICLFVCFFFFSLGKFVSTFIFSLQSSRLLISVSWVALSEPRGQPWVSMCGHLVVLDTNGCRRPSCDGAVSGVEHDHMALKPPPCSRSAFFVRLQRIETSKYRPSFLPFLLPSFYFIHRST